MTAKTNASKTTKSNRRMPSNTKAKKQSPKESATINGKKLSALDAAARVLSETRKALSCTELIEAMAAKGYWTSPGGKTPQATLSSAIQREIVVKQAQSRFKKTAPGRFGLA